jgi:ribonucleoside-diphosphate reductase alpha chain
MSCNLGSINLAQFVENGVFNHDRFVAAIQMGVEFLDNVVSVNQFPVEKIAQMNQETRRIGLGVMGFADLLFQLGIPYDSDEARGFAKSLARTLKEEAFYASVALADEKGAFPAHKDSDYSGGLIPRNAYQTMIAPTGSISILADCSCGIEPIFSLAFEREVMQTQDGSRAKMTEVNPYFKRALEVLAHNMPEIINVEDAIERAIGFVATTGSLDYFTGELSRSKDWKELVKIFQTARDVSMEGHVLMQAAWQEGLDQACSKTINLPADASVEDVEKAYKLAWENGCKGITVYRDGCRDGKQGQVQPMRLAKKEEEEISEIASVLEELFREQDLGRGQLEELPDIAEALKVKQRTPLGTLHVHIVHEGGEFKEIFGQITKSGDQPAADLEAICRLSSLILRLGGTTDMVLKQLEHIGTSQLMPTADGKIKSIPDGLAVALKRAQKELQNSADKEWVTESVSRTIEIQRKETALYKEVCPDCGSVLKMESGCQGCSDPKCGYTRC